ncbi:MAG TPA: electron transport complex subunit RsxA [Gammaproteobacteria bacterium]|jgi:electron transport complex protein RnfA|nr:electron transport complex subunit RsxA [Gammaproteobacteria bacterium]
MGELLLIVLAAALVNNFVLVQFLGLCPAMGASRRLEGAIGMALATGLVLTTASGLSFLVDRFLLQRFDLQYLRLLSFIVVIGASVQLCEILIRRFSPLLHRLLGIYVPLLASNCALLGVALLNSTASRSFVAALFYGAGASLGFGLALALIAGLRERLTHADVPLPFRGAAIVFVTAGILSLAFLGFAGFARL